MKAQQITVEDAKRDIMSLFGFPEGATQHKNSFVHGNEFYISKMDYYRDEVIEKLIEYFNGKVLTKPWGLVIDNITLVFTTFRFEKIPMEENVKLKEEEYDSRAGEGVKEG